MTRGRRVAVVVLVLVAAGAAAAWWWRTRPGPPADPPPVPATPDAEVAALLADVRAEVLADPRSAGAWGKLGAAFFSNLFDRDAAACFAEAARLDPSDPKWPYARGVIASKRDPAAAPDLFRAAAAAGRGGRYEAAAEFRLAEYDLESGELDQARDLFAAAAARSPGDPRAELGLGLVARAQGDAAAAVRHLTAARESPYARKAATTQLAALATARGAPEAAALQAEADALPADPPWPDPLTDDLPDLRAGRRAREREIDRLESQREFARAADLLLHPTSGGPPDAAALTRAGLNLARAGDYEAGLARIREAVRAAPDRPNPHYTLALVLYTRAERARGERTGGPEVEAWFRQVVAAARRAAELDPGHGRAHLFWGLALRQLGRPAEAVEPLKAGAAARPGEFELQLATAEVLLDLNRPAEAAPYLAAARRLNPTDARLAAAAARLAGRKG